MLLFLPLIIFVLASDKKETAATVTDSKKSNLENSAQNLILVKIEEEYVKKTSQYFGVSYNQRDAVWSSCRRSKNEKKRLYHGNYKHEETAALASDTLARKLIEKGEKHHKLNFPEETLEVYPEKSSNYIGVSYIKKLERWRVARCSKNENKSVSNGYYKDEETAAHASDTVARKLIVNGEEGHKLNFPDDDTEVFPKETKTSQYIGVFYHSLQARWGTSRWSKNEKKMIHRGSYKDERMAAHASDTLAKELISNGEKDHKLNFHDDDTQKQIYKRKRPTDSKKSQK